MKGAVDAETVVHAIVMVIQGQCSARLLQMTLALSWLGKQWKRHRVDPSDASAVLTLLLFLRRKSVLLTNAPPTTTKRKSV